MTNYECNGLKYKTNSTKSVKHCPGCGSTDFVMDDCRCELICRRCGMVIDDEFIQNMDLKKIGNGKKLSDKFHYLKNLFLNCC